jgi:hypothetical protein
MKFSNLSLNSPDFKSFDHIRSFTFYKLDYLIDYFNEFENYIQKKSEEFKKNFPHDKNGYINDEDIDPFDYQEQSIRLFGGYQDILRNSIFVMFYSFIESFLVDLSNCDDFNLNDDYQVFLSKFKKKRVNKNQETINRIEFVKEKTNLATIEKWEIISKEFRYIRNQIIHNNSFFSDDFGNQNYDREKNIQKEIYETGTYIINNSSFFEISSIDNNKTFPASIFLKKEFIENTILFIEELFKKLSKNESNI